MNQCAVSKGFSEMSHFYLLIILIIFNWQSNSIAFSHWFFIIFQPLTCYTEKGVGVLIFVQSVFILFRHLFVHLWCDKHKNVRVWNLSGALCCSLHWMRSPLNVSLISELHRVLYIFGSDRCMNITHRPIESIWSIADSYLSEARQHIKIRKSNESFARLSVFPFSSIDQSTDRLWLIFYTSPTITATATIIIIVIIIRARCRYWCWCCFLHSVRWCSFDGRLLLTLDTLWLPLLFWLVCLVFGQRCFRNKLLDIQMKYWMEFLGAGARVVTEQ